MTVATLLKKVEELSARVVALETENIRVNQENSRLQNENLMLRQKLDLYIRHYFGGQRNEGLDKHQLELLLQGLPNVIAVSNAFYNNLFLAGELTISHASGGGGGTWAFRDNLFDRTSNTLVSSSTIDVCSNNAYVTTNYGILLPTNNIVILTNSPAYEMGTLGEYYYPTNLTNLIHQGSRLASAAALYHYTVTPDNAVEGTNTVSIGFHYVATDGNGVPLDSNGDGIPDYLEDANGDGIVDDGETNWALAILTQPISQRGCLGDTVTFTVGADGIPPIIYQWQFDGTNLPGATNDFYSITNFEATNVGSYIVVVTNFSGNITSATATLTTPITNGGYITNGLVAYWKLNDGGGATTAQDFSGNGITLPLSNSPSWITNDCNGVYLTLNGTNQYGDAGSNALTNLDNHDMTICAWINISNTNAQGIVDKSYYYGGWSFFVYNNQLYWSLESGGSFADTGAGIVPLGQWIFVTAAWGYSAHKVSFYINGLLNSDPNNGGVSENPSGPAHLEVGNISTNDPLGGSMHDVAIYNRVLSAEEVASNYLITELATTVPVPDLLYYKMTEYPSYEPTNQFDLADSSIDGEANGTWHVNLPKTLQWQTNVVPNNAIHFDGVSTSVNTSNSTNLNFTTNSFTINLWLLPENEGTYVMGNDSYLSNGWYLAGVINSSKLEFGAETNGADNAIITANGVSGWPTTSWNMVTVTRAGTNTPWIYINGLQVATTGTFTDPASSANSLIFGLGVDSDGATDLDGNIWLPQIWSTNLSPTDVANLYLIQLSGVPWP